MLPLKLILRKLFLKLGLDIHVYDPAYVRVRFNETSVGRKLQLFKRYQINLVLDVGANIGQYGRIIRLAGYKGRIVSFEPLSSAFTQLKLQAQKDALWDVVNIALGNDDGQQTIHVGSNLEISSILPLRRRREITENFIGEEQIEIHRLDSVFSEYRHSNEKIFLKIDAQGYEKKILEGSYLSLPNISGVQLEMSIDPFYEGETPLDKMLAYMKDLGYTLMSIEPGFSDRVTGQAFQVDGIFFRV